jgi:hypothetical protein
MTGLDLFWLVLSVFPKLNRTSSLRYWTDRREGGRGYKGDAENANWDGLGKEVIRSSTGVGDLCKEE